MRKICKVKRALLISWIVLTAASVLFPVALPVALALIGADPMHIAHTRVWFRSGPGEWNRYGNSFGIQIPDGSGFRSLIELPGWVALLSCAAIPCGSMIWLQRRSKGRERQLLRTLWMLLLIWLGWTTLLTMLDYAREIFASAGAASIASAVVISITRAIACIPRKRRQRRVNRGICVRCGYNLTGNVSGVCPECGTTIPLPDPPAVPWPDPPAVPWPVITNLEAQGKSEQ